jgi:uncharacterized protein (TIGR02246 family)
MSPRWWLVASAIMFVVPCGTASAQQAGAPAAAAAPQTQDAATVAAIRAAARSYQEALDRGDGTALAALWTPDGDIVDDEGRVLNGREAVGGITPAGANSPRPAVRIEETTLRLLTADAALEDGTVTVTPPGATAPLKGWFSATWVRHDGAWKLAGLRESRISAPQSSTQLADLEWMVGDWTVVEDHPDREPVAGGLPLTPSGRPPIEVSVRWNATRTFLIRAAACSAHRWCWKRARNLTALLRSRSPVAALSVDTRALEVPSSDFLSEAISCRRN